MTALLTDAVIQKESDGYAGTPGDRKLLAEGFIYGARFARSIYEARLAEAISLMKEAAPAIDLISVTLSERFDRFIAVHAKEDKP